MWLFSTIHTVLRRESVLNFLLVHAFAGYAKKDVYAIRLAYLSDISVLRNVILARTYVCANLYNLTKAHRGFLNAIQCEYISFQKIANTCTCILYGDLPLDKIVRWIYWCALPTRLRISLQMSWSIKQILIFKNMWWFYFEVKMKWKWAKYKSYVKLQSFYHVYILLISKGYLGKSYKCVTEKRLCTVKHKCKLTPKEVTAKQLPILVYNLHFVSHLNIANSLF